MFSLELYAAPCAARRVPRQARAQTSAAAAAKKGFAKMLAENEAPVRKEETCPCGSGLPYAACCGVYHSAPGSEPSADAVLRARFSAYVLGGESSSAYIAASTHPRSKDLVLRCAAAESADTPPTPEAVAAAIQQLKTDAANTSKNIAFKQLTITKSEKGGGDAEWWITCAPRRSVAPPTGSSARSAFLF